MMSRDEMMGIIATEALETPDMPIKQIPLEYRLALLSREELEIIAIVAEALEGYLAKNCGPTADWPVGIIGAEDGAEAVTRHLNELKTALIPLRKLAKKEEQP